MPASQSSAETDSATLPLLGSVTVQSVMSIASVVISLANGVQLSKESSKLSGVVPVGREVGGIMLTVSGLKNFYFLPYFQICVVIMLVSWKSFE